MQTTIHHAFHKFVQGDIQKSCDIVLSMCAWLPMAIIAGAQLAGAAACRLSARFCLRATDKISETDRLIDRIRALSAARWGAAHARWAAICDAAATPDDPDWLGCLIRN